MIKNHIREALPAWVVKVVEKLGKFVDPHAVRSYSQEGEDMILRRVFEGQPAGFYVDVGAHHPVRFSNTYYFYQHGWRGVNIEPNREAVALFRRHRPRDINLALGIGEQPGELTYYRFNEPALNSFDEQLALRRTRETDYRIVGKERVAIARLGAVLSRHLPDGCEIDFLSVDAEGMDLAVLSSNDWELFRPRVVVAEALRADIAVLLAGPINRYLSGLGYSFFAKTHNSVFFVDARRDCTEA